MAIEIRTAVAGDERALTALIASVQQVHVAARPDAFKPATQAELETWAAQAITARHAHVLLAEIAGVVVGYAVVIDEHRADNVFGHERRWREVEQISVDPRHQRRGVARALLEQIAAAARADGIPAVELTTWSFNASASAAFESLGFVPKIVRWERKGDRSAG